MSIDRVDNKNSYFFSERKIIEMVIGIFPYLIMMYPLLQGGAGFLPILIITVIYAIIYSYFLRYRILEEGRLRKMVREMDSNKQSGVEKFWYITKIANGETNAGEIHYDRSDTMERALVVTYDRGSLVGIPEGSYTAHRQAKMDFMKELSDRKMSFRWYELPDKNKQIPSNLMYVFNKMTELDNPAYKQLIRLQLDFNVMFTMAEGGGYRDYILIKNTNFSTMTRFKGIVDDIIYSTLQMDSYIINPRILDEKEVEEFFGEALMIDPVTTSTIRRGVQHVPFDVFAKVHRVLDENGQDVPIETFAEDDINVDTGEETIEEMLEKEQAKRNKMLEKVNRLRETELEKLNLLRVRDIITHRDYLRQEKEIKDKYYGDEIGIQDGLITSEKEIVTVERYKEQQKRKQNEALRKQQAEVAKTTEKEEEIQEVRVELTTTRELREKVLELRRKEIEETEDISELSLEDLMLRQERQDTITEYEKEIRQREEK